VILFVHGWGYDASFWDPLRRQLSDFPSHPLDLGYFGTPDLTIPSGTRLLIGHSLGYLWLARQERLRHMPLIGINGFPRFLQTKDYAPAIAPRVLERMRRHLEMDPAGVLADFWRRAGVPGPKRQPDPAALAAGLDDLALWDERESLGANRKRTYLVAGESDAIVPPEMTRMAFKGFALTWLPGGHALPWTHAVDIKVLLGLLA
jgi:pimeloyl-[acyl-carrier protein] methyl ester esterase